MKVGCVIILGLLMFNGCDGQEKAFHWLIGSWKIQDRNEYEVWKASDGNSTLTGKDFKVQDADTLVTEVIQITYSDQSFHLIADVAGNQHPVDFIITSHDQESFVAENPAHDFPKLIRYKLVRKKEGDFIHATIEGNGKVIPYVFERLK